ncbi:type IA DNA topoisomerase [Campylobacter fetus subsp. venerealis]|uniref:type IA DNA topoisomerase n=1 Tax=Campylobacter fetus TaxID=196 RepID=UPI000818BB05|nr:type IA DNA topoisomerase [Campylobacter fetus]OCS23610.1 DNA topoisomerase I [Campylobacter fetus subsp. venerealis cfvi9825]
MQNTIIIIESPNKCDKIQHITGAKVYATKGHFKELTNQIVADYQSYEPIFDFKSESKSLINVMFNDCKGKDVIIATDPDREGYGIGYMVYDTIKNIAKSVKRAEFHEITESGIKKGLANAVSFASSNLKEFDSFKARAVGDKLVGFIMSPTYINKLNDKNISVGRVQTPALALIVKRELEIKAFNENKANAKIDYKIKAKLRTKAGVEFSAINDNIFANKAEANAKISELNGSTAKVYQIEAKKSETKPKPPFRTSQLQEIANKKLGFSPDKIMSIAQKLFEKGLITYHRTDSNSLSSEFIDEVGAKFGNEEWYEKREYKAGSQSQAEAHEAIRISHIHDFQEIEQISVTEKLTDDEKALYELIFLNSVQSQAKNAIDENTTYDIDIKTLSFKAKTSKCIYKGFKGVLKDQDDDDEKDKEAQDIALNLAKGDELYIIGFELQEVKKQPPQHYKESNFISLLEKEGIGRPSTYATFLPTLLKREYVSLESKGKYQNIIATNKGINFIESVKQDDDWITQSEFTKQMEGVLDEISSGKVAYLDFIRPLHEKMGFKELSNGEIKPPSEKQLEWAKSIAKDLSIALPSGIEADWKICSNFIEKNKGKVVMPPSDKQIELAKKLSKDKGLALPKGYDTNVKICKEFINKAIKKK